MFPARLHLRDMLCPRVNVEFFQKLYRKGLGEFAFRNQIDIDARVNFLDHSSATPLKAPRPESVEADAGFPGYVQVESRPALPRRSAVLLGGGKDSLVSVEIS